ncbi:MAG: hypothetical protein RIQ81_467 [Pseudomonadota bacterium]|jgi:hypothetical protein
MNTPPHGLKPRFELGIDWFQVAIWAAVVVAVLAVAWALWRRWRARPQPLQVTPQPTGPGRVSVLADRVRALQVADPFDARAREDFYFELGIAFRTAIEWRTGIGATSLTLRELREPLQKKLPLPRDEVSAAMTLLERSEGIKFAGAPATPTEATAARDATLRLISRLFPGEVRPR